MFGCKHNWEIISNENNESKFEHALRQVASHGLLELKIPHQMCDATRKNVKILQCTKCGKLKRFVTEI
jgi:hypothetical protein